MLVFGGYLVLKESDSMACACGGHWEFKDGQLVCSNCGKVAPFQPMPSHTEAIERYEELLRVCQDLVEDEISLNEFIILIANLSSPSP